MKRAPAFVIFAFVVLLLAPTVQSASVQPLQNNVPPKAVSGVNFFYYSKFLKLNQTFTELYQKALELGVDNETLQQALNYQKAAEEFYKEGLEAMNPNCETSGIFAFMKFRAAYISIKDGVSILEEAIRELEKTQG